MAEREKIPNRKLKRSKRFWGENGRTGENPQPEGKEKQAG